VKPIIQQQLRKPHDSSIECDETESELVAIPESDLSDSTLQGSIDGGMSTDDVAPLKSDIKKKQSEIAVAPLKSSMQSKPSPSNECKSLSDGMRQMMFSSAILSPSVNVQKAIVVTQAPLIKPSQSSSKDTSHTAHQLITATTSQLRTVSAAVLGEKQHQQRAVVQPLNANGNGGIMAKRSNSPIRALGRQQRIIDTNGQQSDDQKKSTASYLKHVERRTMFGSPESPLSRMDVMTLSETDLSTDDAETPTQLLTPTSVKLEFPTPERLLPIGNTSSVSNLCERVREALSIPDISHLKSQDNLDKSESSQHSPRASSPRKLTKQVALVESPPHVHDPNEMMKKGIHKHVNAKKVGTFAVQNEDSRLKYAGSWAPQAVLEDDYDDEDSGSTKMHYTGSETKLVRNLINFIKN
jgi:hypothetical protein